VRLTQYNSALKRTDYFISVFHRSVMVPTSVGRRDESHERVLRCDVVLTCITTMATLCTLPPRRGDNISSEKPVSKFAFQMQPTTLHRGGRTSSTTPRREDTSRRCSGRLPTGARPAKYRGAKCATPERRSRIRTPPVLEWVAPKAGAGGLTWWGCTAHRCCVRVTLVRL
jgi:hypothetical protein